MIYNVTFASLRQQREIVRLCDMLKFISHNARTGG